MNKPALVVMASLLAAWQATAGADLLVERARYDAGAKVRASATVADLDRTGASDIVFGTSAGEVIAMSPSAAPKWIARGMAEITVPPAAADILPEPGLELVVGDWKGYVRCLSARGRTLWQTRVGDQVDWSSPAILGVGGPDLRPTDSSPLIVVGDATGGLCAFSASGKLVWRYRTPAGVTVACPPSAGDVDGDGAEEIIFGAGDGIIRCLSRQGRDKWSFKTGDDAFTGPVIADLNGDKQAEIVTASGDGYVYVLDGATGKLVWKFNSGAAVDSSIAVADVLSSPGLEVAFANNNGNFDCLSARGELLWSHTLEARAVAPPCIADLDADGTLELTIGDHKGKLYVFSASGRLLETHDLAGRVNAAPTALRLPEGLALVVPDEGSQVHVFLAPASMPAAAIAWSGFRGDPTGCGDARAFGGVETFPISIIAADPGRLLMGAAVLRVKVRNDTAADALVKLQVVAPQGRMFVADRRQGRGEETYELDYEILAGGEYRFAVTAQPVSGKSRPARWERSAQVTPFARDVAEMTRLLGEAQDAAARLNAGGLAGAKYAVTAVSAISADAAELNLARFDSLEQAERRAMAASFRALLDRAERLAAKAQFAVAAQASGRRDFAAWAAQPYAALDQNAVPADATPQQILLTLCRGERRPAALNIFNFRDEPLPLRILVSDLKSAGGGAAIPAQDALTLRRVVFAPSTDYRLYPDALPRLDAIDSLTVAPWEAAQLWIAADATGLAPGVYSGAITLAPITPGVATQQAPLEIRVRSLAMEGRSPLASCQWAYLDVSITADKMQQAADDLLAHLTTVFPFVGAATAPPKADAQGNLMEPLDFTAHDTLFNLYHRPKGWLLYLTGSPQLTSAVEPFSPAWEKICAAWLKGMADHTRALGLDYKDWAWYPIDEAGKKEIPNLLRAAKFAKSVDPRIQMYYDFFQGALEVPLDDLKKLNPYIDIWQPHRGIVEENAPENVARMDFLRSTGEPVWMYDTAGGAHALSPGGYYRSQGWLAWQKRITGVGFWTYNATSNDQWQAGNEQEYLAIYQGREIVPSKRWEAYRDGIEDYWLLLLLRQAGEKARAAGRADLAKQAEDTIASAVSAVMSDRANPRVYEDQRLIIADLAERILAAVGGGG